MSFLARLFSQIKNCCCNYPTINSHTLVDQEKKSVETEFSTDFDKNFKDYLANSYRPHIDSDYKNYVSNFYTYIDKDKHPAKERPNYGLALSGGGIRSAAFGTGVMQALHNKGFAKEGHPTVFEKLQYLSSVSGGGYAGAALSWFMKRWGAFPFGNLENFCGSKANTEVLNTHELKTFAAKAQQRAPESTATLEKEAAKTSAHTDYPQQSSEDDAHNANKVLSYIRLHGNYLTPPQLPLVSLIGFSLGSAIHSFFAYLFLFSLIFMSLITVVYSEFLQSLVQDLPAHDYIYNLLDSLVNFAINYDQKYHYTYTDERINFFLYFTGFAGLLGVAFLLLQTFYALSSIFTRPFSKFYKYRIEIQSALGWLLTMGICSLILALVPLQSLFFSRLEIGNPAFWGSGGASLVAIFMAISEFRKRLKPALDSNSLYADLFRNVVIIGFIFIIISVAYWMGEGLYHLSLQATINRPFELSVNVYILLMIIFLLVVNINYISPHKMYRDRLMDTFLRDPSVSPYSSLAKKGEKANEFRLSELKNKSIWSPYHLINTNIILNKSNNPQYKSRLGDNFILSPDYCGSDATGYVETRHFSLNSMTLATATAISGAAANPHAGVGGEGNSTSPLVSFLMTFFGLRLGFWANNPTHFLTRFKFIFKPNYVFPGANSLFNLGHKENSPHIELSDGGHFDNTGIYELIRRRLPWIILSDGSADLATTFEDLGNAISRIRVDFGVTIRFRDERFNLCGLIPRSQDITIADKKFELSERGYAIGDIVYPDTETEKGFVGTFVYIKACITRDLPADIYAYKALNAQFPNQPTADQFFDERQFESYRELGYQLTKQLLINKDAMARLP